MTATDLLAVMVEDDADERRYALLAATHDEEEDEGIEVPGTTKAPPARG